jgi:hypothetical protein
MTLNGSGARDIVCVLGVSSATIIDVLKKSAGHTVNKRLLQTLDPQHMDVILRKLEAAEIDEIVLGWDTPPCSGGVTIESIVRPMTHWTTDTSIEHLYTHPHCDV